MKPTRQAMAPAKARRGVIAVTFCTDPFSNMYRSSCKDGADCEQQSENNESPFERKGIMWRSPVGSVSA
jgi:hypothetical protein